jgi:hypothetical protein
MSVPIIVNDGNFANELANGSIVLSTPLARYGDFNHLVARRKMRVDVGSFKMSNRLSLAQLPVSTGDGSKTLRLVDSTDPELVGNNLMEWEEIYANVPAQRTEPTTITYTQQYLWFQANADQSTTISIVEFTRKRSATITYDYFLKTSQLPALYMPKLEQFGNRILQFGGWRAFLNGETVLAEDSSVERYMGDIFVRKSTYISWAAGLPYTPPPGAGI